MPQYTLYRLSIPLHNSVYFQLHYFDRTQHTCVLSSGVSLFMNFPARCSLYISLRWLEAYRRGERREEGRGHNGSRMCQVEVKGDCTATCTSVSATGGWGHLSSSPTSLGGRFLDNFTIKFTRTKSRNCKRREGGI